MKLPTSLLRPWRQENTRHPFPLSASRSRGGMVRFQAWHPTIWLKRKFIQKTTGLSGQIAERCKNPTIGCVAKCS